jgi:midasin
VLVPQAEENLKSLSRAVAACQPVVLSGPIGSGKTLLVEHLAAELGRRMFAGFHRVQISDMLDGRGLLGSYICSSVPGHFEWKTGEE